MIHVSGRFISFGMKKMLIGELAALAGVKTDTVRFYQRRGLLRRPSLSAGAYRRYDEAALRRLQFIRHAQSLGFSLAQIERILRADRSGRNNCCDVVLATADAVLADAEARLTELKRFRHMLARRVELWLQEVEGGCDETSEFCRLIESTPSVGTEYEASPSRQLSSSGKRRQKKTACPGAEL